MRKILVISNTAFSIEKFREHYLSKIKDFRFKIYTPNILVNLKNKHTNIEQKKFVSNNIYDDFKKLYKIIKDVNASEIIVYSFKYQFIISILKKIYSFDYKIISVIAGRGSLNLGNIFRKHIYHNIINYVLSCCL